MPFDLISTDFYAPDLSHHLSKEARTMQFNPMKTFYSAAKYNVPGLISLANGDPHSSLYPMKSFSVEVSAASIEVPDPVSLFKQPGSDALTQRIEIYKHAIDDPRHSSNPGLVHLDSAFKYTHGAGLAETQRMLGKFTELFHHPPKHINHSVTLTLGNFDGVTKAFRMLGDAGQYFLTEEFAFRALTNAPLAYGVKWVGVKMDDDGIIPEALDDRMEQWDERIGKRPHVLYLVPCGQNPTGSTLPLERRMAIYRIAQKWDIIIVEDDPYYFLQYDLELADESWGSSEDFAKEYAQSLVPSFLSLDTDGRVIRLDSFSKIIAPGMRLGWITSSSMFHDKLVMLTDSSSQHPHAFGQTFVTELLSSRGWDADGFIRWVRSLCREYQKRRNLLLELIRKEIPGEYATTRSSQAGMFLWVKVHVEKHPRFVKSEEKNNGVELVQELCDRCLEDGLIIIPGFLFAMEEQPELTMGIDDSDVDIPIKSRANFIRLTFCGQEEVTRKGIGLLSTTLATFFKA